MFDVTKRTLFPPSTPSGIINRQTCAESQNARFGA